MIPGKQPNPRLKADIENARFSGSLVRDGLTAWGYAVTFYGTVV